MDSWAKLAWTNMDNGQRDECKAYIVEVFNEGSAAHFAFLDQISMVEVGACTPQEAYEELSKFFDGKENLMSLLKVILGLKRHTQDGSTNKEDLRKGQHFTFKHTNQPRRSAVSLQNASMVPIGAIDGFRLIVVMG